MRTLKRWIRKWQAYRAAQPQLAVCRPPLEQLFGGPVTWRQTGGRGRDVVCLVLRSGRPVGVLRVTHPATPFSVPAASGLPFVSLPATAKIQREWQAYSAGYGLGLTPQPLWHNELSLLCAYVSAQSLKQEAEKTSVLGQATAALPDIARLHAAGLTHMDMSLSNILYDAAGKRSLFVDFEYGPAERVTFEQQCLYDDLRLLESVWKELSPEERSSAPATWCETFRATAPASVQAASLAPLRPALGRILAAPELRPFFQGFSG
jgi:hypothetical protein